MADTVKSRIVSDDNGPDDVDDLEESLMEEFNLRLKSCMSQDNLDQHDDDQSQADDETHKIAPFKQPMNLITASQDLIRAERNHCNGHRHHNGNKMTDHEQIYENLPPRNDHRPNGNNNFDIIDHDNDVDKRKTDQSYVDMTGGPAPRMADGHAPEISHRDIVIAPEVEMADRHAPGVEMAGSPSHKAADKAPEVEMVGSPAHEVADRHATGIGMAGGSASKMEGGHAPRYEEVLPAIVNNKPDLILTDADQPEESKMAASPRDRMFLSTDAETCLLFTQTVTSPMLTPSEESVDFLRGFETRQNGGGDDSGLVTDLDQPDLICDNPLYEKFEENIYENLCEGANENIYENVPNKSARQDGGGGVVANGGGGGEMIYQNLAEVGGEEKSIGDKMAVDKEVVKEFIESERRCEMAEHKLSNGELKSTEIVKEYIGKIREVDSTTQVTETYVETRTIESSDGLATEKGIKKKKTKKTRKEEKENISVTTNGLATTTNDTKQDSNNYFYNVDVKNLCRSFGDLSKINGVNKKRDHHHGRASAMPTQRVKSLPDVSSYDSSIIRYQNSNNKLEPNVFSGVSVRALKSSFNKFDALQKKNVLHVRSSDSSKAQEKFNGAQVDSGASSNCKECDKPVFQMEQMKAEKAVWHRNCFRCKECNKQLNVDTYQSHEGTLYCKPHFKALFAPKAVEEDAPPSDKPDLGLEELQSLNVKERFQVFENHSSSTTTSELLHNQDLGVKRSPSILSKLARFQARGMDVGVTDEALNGIPIEESSSEAEEEQEEELGEGEDADLVRARKVQKEKPFHFTGMSDVKSRWEQGDQTTSRDERREERKQEIQSIRNRLFMGKQGKMKEAYQQAVMESESCANLRNKEKIEVTDTKSLKERFERGDLVRDDEDKADCEDVEVYESEISKNSRSLFLELDAHASKPPQLTPLQTPKLDVKKAREASTPDREVYRDPEVVRSEEYVEDSVVAKQSHTATKMLNKFRQMEENLLSKEPQSLGPKPLKRFTPPPEPLRPESSSGEDEDGESEDDEEEGDDEIDQQRKVQDDDLLEAQKAARAKQLRAKFERWEANEIKREQNGGGVVNIAEEIGETDSQIESTKSLRARFESMRETSTSEGSNRTTRVVKVNRFVELPNVTETCESCQSRVYPLEKVSVHNQIYHKKCFKCMECSCMLRMDSYSYNQGLLYCLPHFKRLFISKGNYDTGFGLSQHKEKWNSNNNATTVN